MSVNFFSKNVPVDFVSISYIQGYLDAKNALHKRTFLVLRIFIFELRSTILKLLKYYYYYHYIIYVC